MRLVLAVFVLAMVGPSCRSEPGPGDKNGTGGVGGVVVREDGTPCPAESLRLVLMPERMVHYSKGVKTDSLGAFSFTSVAAGDYVVAYGPLLRQWERVVVEPGRTTAVRLVLKLEGVVTLEGTVSKAAEPVADAEVYFYRLDPNPSRMVWPPGVERADTSETGRYAVRVEAGRYLVSVREKQQTSPADGAALGDLARDLMDDGAGRGEQAGEPAREGEEPTAGTETSGRGSFDFVRVIDVGAEQDRLDLAVPEGVVKGILTDPSGKPVQFGLLLSPSEVQAGWCPAAMSVAATVDRQGRFRFEHVAQGTYDLSLLQAGSGAGVPYYGVQFLPGIRVAGAETVINWRLADPVIAEVLGGKDDASAVPYLVAVSEEHPKLRSVFSHQVMDVRDTDAWYLSPALAYSPGRYLVFAADSQQATACDAKVVDFIDRPQLSFQWRAFGSVKVVLKGTPAQVSGRTVRLTDGGVEVPRLHDPLWSYDPEMIPAIVLPTAPDGVTTVGWLAPGEYTVRVDGERVEDKVSVKAGEVARAVIELGDR